MTTHPLTIDDSHEAIGTEPDDHGLDDFGYVIELCSKSPSGHCEYGLLNPCRCKHCGRFT